MANPIRNFFKPKAKFDWGLCIENSGFLRENQIIAEQSFHLRIIQSLFIMELRHFLHPLINGCQTKNLNKMLHALIFVTVLFLGKFIFDAAKEAAK